MLISYITDRWTANLGLNWKLGVIDGKTVTSRIRRANFDFYGRDGWGADYPDQQDWMDIFQSGSCHSLNWGCPTLAGYDALVSKADTELSQSQRNADYLTAQKMLIDQAAAAFMYQPYEYDLVAPYVSVTHNA